MASPLRKSAGFWTAVAALLIAALLLPAAAGATYQKIRVPYPAEGERSRLFFHPDLEFMGDDDGALILLSRPELTQELVARGFQVEIVVPDVEADYVQRAGPLRDYGVWHTYAETVDEMNLLHSQYPNLTTAPASIGTTGEGRTIWAMKISDNPNVQESEAEVYFDGMHHAREIMTVEVLLHYMRYLCENYGTDPVITFLVNNRQIWFIPLVNVDGFVYNETTNPNGGGMWRKNRRNNGGGCYGVDNNRNYPFQWVGGGSSTDPCNDTYRGPSQGSEPENQAVMNLINAHQFVLSQSYHSVAGMVLLPWSYTSNHTPDDALLRSIATEMARAGGYQVGQPPELLYDVNGGSIDWHYADGLGHQKIYAFCTEVGGSDFWPQPSERDQLIGQNLYSNIYLCQIAGAYLDLLSSQLTDQNSNGRLDPGETGSIAVTVKNLGVVSAATNVRATLSCDDPYIVLSDAQSDLGTVAAGATVTSSGDPFDLVVDPACPAGRPVNFVVSLTADGGLRVDETIALTVGQLPVLYADDFEQAGGAWSSDPSHTATTGAFVRADPVATTFQPGDDTTPAPGVNAWFTGQNPTGDVGVDDVDNGMAATRSPLIDLSSVSRARLEMSYFHGQRDTGDDPSGDFFRIDLSNDGGATFPANLLLIGDVTTAGIWRNLRIDLGDQLPLTASMVIRVQAADGVGATGMADIIEGGLDDVYIFNPGADNEPPAVPVLVSPPDGAPEQPASVALVVANAPDPDGDPVTYGFRVYADPLLTQLVASVDGVPEGAGGMTSWNVSPPLAQATHYWRAYAADPYSRSLYMEPASFAVTNPNSAVESQPVSSLLSAGPNPASGRMRIRYYTPNTPSSTLDILDAAGRNVRRLPGARWSEGWHEVVWDGCMDGGAPAPAGVYWVRLALPGETRTVRVVQVR